MICRVAALMRFQTLIAAIATTSPAPRDESALWARLASALSILNADAGSASRIERPLLLETHRRLDAGAITEKGYRNQRRCLESRVAEVARLYGDHDVIRPA
ncbi:MAG: hypothetical protein JOZ64_05620 [Solirubrobacterales bacterium]|nr:hypothetical protein [Solirubrobacterales bacterium]